MPDLSKDVRKNVFSFVSLFFDVDFVNPYSFLPRMSQLLKPFLFNVYS